LHEVGIFLEKIVRGEFVISNVSGWLLFLVAVGFPVVSFGQSKAEVWITNPDKSALFQLQSPDLRFGKLTKTDAAGMDVIDVFDTDKFQTIDGFGFALTGGSAQLLVRMDAAKRAELLHELFTVDGNGIGVSYLRVTVGSSDLNDHVYTYDDVPEGQSDPMLDKFSLDADKADVIPVLKQILAIDPKMKLLASPWSAPAWMKTNGNAKAGKLRPECYEAYANYLVKYIEGMKAEGIPIDAITIQNEPLNEKNTPSMLMLSEDEGAFLRDHFGPALKKAGLKTKVILYDHNLDHPEYATSILKDSRAAKYADGSGFHLYGGKIEAMSGVHDEFPKKNLYFTEQMVVNGRDKDRMNVARPVGGIVIGATRNWSRNVLLWNLAADANFGPHTSNGGCPVCQGAVTIEGDEVTRNLAYYSIAQVSKFVRPGSVRIGSNETETLRDVAFKTPGGRLVVLVTNTGAAAQKFALRFHDEAIATSLDAGAVGTYIWQVR
jgi:glucosylceramidase